MVNSEDNLREIASQAGLQLLTYERVYGGDINQAYKFNCREGRFFLKLNHASKFPQMFEKEARGLDALRSCNSLLVPEVVRADVLNGFQYLMLEWLEPGKPEKNFWEEFGRGLALVHKHTHETFGWEEDNYIGSLVQKNKPHNCWPTFYGECRIMPLVKTLYEQKRISTSDVTNAEVLCESLNKIFPPEQPALLHGDLWIGNFITSKNGMVAIYDPAVYFGNREMDVAMTLLFGGFDVRFYDSYNEAFPLAPNWEKRMRIAQLYPLLVHAVLFDGHYVASVTSHLKEFH